MNESGDIQGRGETGNRAIVIAGPTASGKSGLALDLALSLRDAGGATIVNADSMQVYADLPILSAQPDAEAMSLVPHRLYGIRALDAPCTAALWAELALAEMRQAWGEGRLPILVGGTGLYLRALMQGLHDLPEVPAAIRDETRALMDELGAPELHRRLAQVDAVTAARLAPNDRQRTARAWEIWAATGRALSAWLSDARPERSPARFLSFVVMPPRTHLYDACDARFAAMLDRGARDEVRAVLKHYPEPARNAPGFKALGFRELAAVEAGTLDLQPAVAAAQQSTRNYAKRQVTWFRNQLADASLLSPDRPAMKFSQSYIDELSHKIRSFGLTPVD